MTNLSVLYHYISTSFLLKNKFIPDSLTKIHAMKVCCLKSRTRIQKLIYNKNCAINITESRKDSWKISEKCSPCVYMEHYLHTLVFTRCRCLVYWTRCDARQSRLFGLDCVRIELSALRLNWVMFLLRRPVQWNVSRVELFETSTDEQDNMLQLWFHFWL